MNMLNEILQINVYTYGTDLMQCRTCLYYTQEQTIKPRSYYTREQARLTRVQESSDLNQSNSKQNPPAS